MLLFGASGSLVEMPLLRKWLVSLDNSQKNALCENVASVIEDVFSKKSKMKFKKSRTSRVGTNCARMQIYSGGILHLATIGEFATLDCCYDSIFSLVVYREYNYEKILEDLSIPIGLDFHNVVEIGDDDCSPRVLSLLAGAGAVAWYAKNAQAI
jgi:hypothetical protein